MNEAASTIPDRAPAWRRAPALLVGALLAGLLVVLWLETVRLMELRRENTALRAVPANLEQLREENAELERLRAAAPQAVRTETEQEEVVKLRTEVAHLITAAQQLPALRAEGQRLAAERAALAAKAGVAAEEDPFAQAKGRAQRISCISNIKQICLAARIWELENRSPVMPPDFLTMRNELNTPKILTCAADSARTRADDWPQFNGSSVSYELLSPGADSRDPQVVFVRCPVCNNVGLTDGSAHQLNAVDRVEKVDGKFKIVRGNSPTNPTPP